MAEAAACHGRVARLRRLSWRDNVSNAMITLSASVQALLDPLLGWKTPLTLYDRLRD